MSESTQKIQNIKDTIKILDYVEKTWKGTYEKYPDSFTFQVLDNAMEPIIDNRFFFFNLFPAQIPGIIKLVKLGYQEKQKEIK